MTRRDPDAAREALQTSLDARRTKQERNRLGQFATPTLLAKDIARAALQSMGDAPIRFLDPSIGLGAFYSALVQLKEGRDVESARGVELDDRLVRGARRLFKGAGLRLTRGDFTRVKPPRTDSDRATLVLANPPYVRHHHIPSDAKRALQEHVRSQLGIKVSGLTGLYVYFALLCDAWMSDGCVAAWLVPGEWMDVNYGEALRTYLASRVSLIRIHRFNLDDVQFGDALVSSSVVFFRKLAPSRVATCEFTQGSLVSPRTTNRVPVPRLTESAKWSTFFGEANTPTQSSGARPACTIGDLFDVRRGIATGCNKFFVRSRAEFLENRVPAKFLRAVLPSSRHIEGGVIEADSDGYPKGHLQLALLDCDVAESHLRTEYAGLWSYLNSPLGKQVRARYLSARRTPWYAQEKREHAPIVASYMGRGRQGAAPFRFFRNDSNAIATNVYLMLIPKPHLRELFRTRPAAAEAVCAYLRTKTADELSAHGRVYGGGLHKLEPRELARIDVTPLAELFFT